MLQVKPLLLAKISTSDSFACTFYGYLKGSYSVSFNGGGSLSTGAAGGQGGGATDFRTVSGSWNDAASLRSRIIVAAGGGASGHHNGSYDTVLGTAGGGLSSNNVTPKYSSSYAYGHGATQTAAGSGYGTGSFGTGGSATGGSNGGGSGGGGWYGGGGGRVNQGAGGSSYISGHTGCVAVTSTSSSSPKSGCTTGTTDNSCSISPYGYTFSNTVMIDGDGYQWTTTKGSQVEMPYPSDGTFNVTGKGKLGNGYARITYLGVSI